LPLLDVAPADRSRLKIRDDGTAGELDALPIEHRFSTLGEVSIDADVRTFEGYAVRWGVMNTFREIFQKGAFARTLAHPPVELRGRKPSMYLHHNRERVIGQWLDIREDDTGLFVRGRIVASPAGDDALALIREKIVTGLSIGYIDRRSRIENKDDWKTRITHVEDADLYEISVVESASDRTAGVTAVRLAVRDTMTVRDVERVLRGIDGLPRDVAKAMAGCWKPKDGEAREASGDDGEAELRDAAASEAATREDAEAMSKLIALLRS